MLAKAQDSIAEIAVDGKPVGAIVTVNGRPVGTLPLPASVRVAIGRVVVKVSAPGHVAADRVLQVRGKETIGVTVVLDPATASPETAKVSAEFGGAKDGASPSEAPQRPDAGRTASAHVSAREGPSSNFDRREIPAAFAPKAPATPSGAAPASVANVVKPVVKEGQGQSGHLFLAVAGGSGLGVASGKGALDPNAHQVNAPGFAFAQAGQLAPEIGVFVSSRLLVSAALRFQYVTELNGKPSASCDGEFCSPKSTAWAAFAKTTWLFGDSDVRLAVGGQVGAGHIRHVLVFSNDPGCKASATSSVTETCVDSLDGGPFLVGPTVGLFWELGDTVDVLLAANTALGMPTFTLNFDVQVGVGFRFF